MRERNKPQRTTECAVFQSFFGKAQEWTDKVSVATGLEYCGTRKFCSRAVGVVAKGGRIVFKLALLPKDMSKPTGGVALVLHDEWREWSQ